METNGAIPLSKIDRTLLFTAALLASFASAAILYVITDLRESIHQLQDASALLKSRATAVVLVSESNEIKIEQLQASNKLSREMLISMRPTKIEAAIEENTKKLSALERELDKLEYTLNSKDKEK
jgi:vacuolar-type H+-ATPase subunit I/STV1